MEQSTESIVAHDLRVERRSGRLARRQRWGLSQGPVRPVKARDQQADQARKPRNDLGGQ